MKIFCIPLWVAVLLFFSNRQLAANDKPDEKKNHLSVNGYIKGLPSLESSSLTDGVHFDNVFQNRLNFKYTFHNDFCVVAELRQRLLSGRMVSDYNDLMVESMKADNGLLDASFLLWTANSHIWHLHADRFYAEWQHQKWQVRVGRQRINWGINMVSNPNDLFNTYSFFDFDYEERPGADAVRVQYFTGNLSRLELAVSPAREARRSTAAMMYAFNTNGYDLQFIAGYYRHRTALGAGWAGSIGTSGFKGEVSMFNSIGMMDSMAVVAAVSLDHLFGNGMYGLVEALYNGGNKTTESNLLLMSQPMAADNIFISKYAITASVTYPVSPVLSGSGAAMYMPDLNAWYLMPNLTLSAATNFDLSLLLQFFSIKQDNAHTRFIKPFLQMKWSF